jgi:1,4-alpha-glucan branching enzyme
MTAQQPVGTCCLVLHSHLPWVLHAGAWPVGEEWLHQAWTASYLRVTDVLTTLAAQGRRDLLTLG